MSTCHGGPAVHDLQIHRVRLRCSACNNYVCSFPSTMEQQASRASRRGSRTPQYFPYLSSGGTCIFSRQGRKKQAHHQCLLPVSTRLKLGNGTRKSDPDCSVLLPRRTAELLNPPNRAQENGRFGSDDDSHVRLQAYKNPGENNKSMHGGRNKSTHPEVQTLFVPKSKGGVPSS